MIKQKQTQAEMKVGEDLELLVHVSDDARAPLEPWLPPSCSGRAVE